MLVILFGKVLTLLVTSGVVTTKPNSINFNGTTQLVMLMAEIMQKRPIEVTPNKAAGVDFCLRKQSDSNACKHFYEKAINVISRFDSNFDTFFERLQEYVGQSGYDELDLARQPEGARLLLELFFEPIQEHYHQKKYPLFKELINNSDGWVDKLVEVGVFHWRSGIRVSMFLGYMKTFLWAVNDTLTCITDNSDKSFDQHSIAAAQAVFDLYRDAFEVLWVELALMDPTKPRSKEQEDASCLLTLEKCRFAKIFNITSDGVLVMDNDCRVVAVNNTLRAYLDEGWHGKYIWDVLGLEGINTKEALFTSFPLETRFETALFRGRLHFRMGISCLGDVSPAHRSDYVGCLSDITQLVRQKEILKSEVNKRTQELVQEKKQLEEMNITLRNVIKNTNDDREQSLHELARSIRHSICPAIRKTCNEESTEARHAYTEILIQQLERLLSPTHVLGGSKDLNEAGAEQRRLGSLTMTEYRVCQLIQAGNSTKRIAELLNISPETVKTHRRSIRRKLNLRGHNSQLGTFLLNIQE